MSSDYTISHPKPNTIQALCNKCNKPVEGIIWLGGSRVKMMCHGDFEEVMVTEDARVVDHQR